MSKTNYLLFALLLWCLNSAIAQSDPAANPPSQQLRQVQGVVGFQELKPAAGFQSAYEIHISQPLDHDKPKGPRFSQRIFLSHIDYSKPMVVITEGYSSHRNYTSELAKKLNANQLIIEHRYFGASAPDSLIWEHLTIEEAAEDQRHIIEQFKKLYGGKWISTGISKGGQTALYLKYFYPDLVDVVVPYVAPINRELEDPRIYEFLKTVGDEECRQKIFAFQRRLLEKRAELLPFAKWYVKGKGYEFTSLSLEAAYEYAVLEYSFSFWQNGNDCAKIPDQESSIDEMLDHLLDAVGFSLYCDRGIAYYAPHFYQAINQVGYYGFETKGFDDLLVAVKEPTNKVFAPKVNEEEFNPKQIQKIQKWLETKADKVIYIYGALDTWSATGINPSPKVDALRIMMPNRSHSDARIKNMSAEEKRQMRKKLEKWLGMDLPLLE